MFTGIIEAVAQILEKKPSGLVIERPQSFTDLKLGSSISVSGVCLSVVKLTKSSMQFNVVAETLKKTTVKALKKGDRVNLERAMKAGDRLEGHVVQGHVEGVGIVKNDPSTGSGLKMKNGLLILQLQKTLISSVIPKGSIAIDGVSLTVVDADGDQVTIALIPHTLKNTTLGSLKKGDQVNVETDVMVRSHRAMYPAHSHAH